MLEVLRGRKRQPHICCSWTFCMNVKSRSMKVPQRLTCMCTCKRIHYIHCVCPGMCLQNILSFFSGAEAVPPVGFETQASLYFSSSAVLPTASTCALSLTLPTHYYNDPIAFKEKMTFAIMNHGGFGLR